MTVELDIRAVELLCSRLCHELVSPVGAINNGVELIEEMGKDMVDEAMGLIAHSADQASRRLRVLRLAYGAAGAEAAGFRDVLQAASSYFDGGKITLDWVPGRLDEALAGRRGVAKAVLNLLVLAEEALAYGGTALVEPHQGGILVAAQGRAAGLRPDVRLALEGRVAAADLTPRTVHAYVTGRFAEHYGLRLGFAERSDRLDLVLHL